MADPFSVFDRMWTITLTRRTDGGMAAEDGTWVKTTTTTSTIKGHLVIGPYDENARTSDHLLAGRAKQAGLVVERGEAIFWMTPVSGIDVLIGDQLEFWMDAAGAEKKKYLVLEELDRPHLIEKLTQQRAGRRKLKLKAEAPT